MGFNSARNTVVVSLAALLIGVLFAGCSSVTEISGSWANHSYAEKPLSRIIIFAIGGKSFVSKATMETVVATEFNNRGGSGTASVDVFDAKQYDSDADGKIDDPSSKDLMVAKVRELGFDGAMVVAVRNVTEQERYVPGTVTYQPRSFYNGWYSYWSNTYERVETPGYTTTEVSVFLEVSLFDTSNEKLVWSAQTTTLNPTSIQDASESFANSVVPKIIHDGVAKGSK